MSRFYEGVVKYDKQQENGEVHKVTESYLLEAVSCTDTEAMLIQELKPFIVGDISVTSVKMSKYAEYIPENWSISQIDGEAKRLNGENSQASKEADRYFSVKISFITLDEVKGKEKRASVYYLVHAASVDAAHCTMVEFMKGGLADYEINTISETKIVEVILSEPADENREPELFQ